MITLNDDELKAWLIAWANKRAGILLYDYLESLGTDIPVQVTYLIDVILMSRNPMVRHAAVKATLDVGVISDDDELRDIDYLLVAAAGAFKGTGRELFSRGLSAWELALPRYMFANLFEALYGDLTVDVNASAGEQANQDEVIEFIEFVNREGGRYNA